jgi:hypothetical protein
MMWTCCKVDIDRKGMCGGEKLGGHFKAPLTSLIALC